MKKKIGLLLESSPSAGGTFQINQFYLEAVSALPPERFSVVVGYTSELWLEHLKGYHLESVAVPMGSLSRAIGQGWKLLGLPMALWRKLTPLFHPMGRALLRQNCDLWVFPSQSPRSFQFPIPTLVCIHDLMHRYEPHFPEAISWWEYLNRERNFSNMCQWGKGVLVDSELGRHHVADSYGTPLERIYSLPFIAPAYMSREDCPPGFESRYRLPPKFIFYPAQFWEHKNHKRLIRAVHSLKKELPDLKLVLAGSKKGAFDSMMKLVGELGLSDDVQLLGYVPDEDMPELYRRARALVMPTFYGPTNIPPLEAFVAGCPVAISGIYGMPEQAGDAALLFDPRSEQQMADCIRRLWTDDRLCAELVAKGKRRIENWGQQQFNARFLQIIDKVLAV
ncbi:MAG: glycosyl transferase family 1 [Geobacteraceae bacterium GWC2_58_44]|nr:MAG: glycosyl transferase family 1 [Geobacteraceae bacterium GWC2_58_44]HBG05742.1 glycosyltransferase family 1 protein [Geobacter sp.]